MSKTLRNSIVLAVLMCVASVLAYALRPGAVTIDAALRPNYEQVVPAAFGDWAVDTRVLGGVVNPQQQDLLDQLYSEIVNRVYLNKVTGERIMLSLAYGENQSKQNQVHRPEVCYPAQGFQIISRENAHLVVANTQLPVMKIVAKAGQRVEPVTYWIRVGDTVVAGYVDQKVAAIRRSLAGEGADGLLFRVSSIGEPVKAQFSTQESFTREFLAAVPVGSRAHFIGGAGLK